MSSLPTTSAEDVIDQPARAQFEVFLDEHRGALNGPLPLRWVYLHVLRELAQHCGHADILREQLVNE